MNRLGLWAAPSKVGWPSKFNVRSFHNGMTASMFDGGSVSSQFNVLCGTEQGCVLAPLLFSIFFAMVLHVMLLCSHHYSMAVRHGHCTGITSRNFHLHCLRRILHINGRIEYQTPLSLSSVTSPASSRCCSELSFIGVAMLLACQMSIYPSTCYTANFQMPNVIQVVSGREI